MSIKQNQAVVNAICSIRNVEEFSEKVVLSKDEMNIVSMIVAEAMMVGNVELNSKKLASYEGDVEKLRKDYVKGMVSNTLRKDKRLTGGEKYVGANPGSRSKDEMLVSLIALRKVVSVSEYEAIDKAIEDRKAELAALKGVKEVVINVEALPEALRYLVK
jgi:hypothetical protein